MKNLLLSALFLLLSATAYAKPQPEGDIKSCVEGPDGRIHCSR